MALALIGGLLVATVLTLMFLPALYAWAFRVRPERKAAARRTRAAEPVAVGR